MVIVSNSSIMVLITKGNSSSANGEKYFSEIN